MAHRFTLLLQDKNIVIVMMVLVAISILVPGLLKIGPPQWLHTETGTMETASQDHTTGTTIMTAPVKPSMMAPDIIDTDIIDTDIKSTVETAHTPEITAMAVPRLFTSVIPKSHVVLATSQQKQHFIKMVLPLILAANEEIIQRRAAIQRAYDRKDALTLGKWAKLYKLPPEDIVSQGFLDNLLARVDVIPVPLALAQAAIESGWGTSRFARQGNALFGQWAWQESVGIKPLNASNQNAVVRSFPNLLGSVRAYIHNLNTHQAYQTLRDTRAKLGKISKEDHADILVKYLHNYAETGTKYVDDLNIIMRKNALRQYANAFLS